MTIKSVRTILLILALTLSGILQSQNSTPMKTHDSTAIKARAFQLSFITPLGTNGLDSWNVTNAFSINLITGYAGGIHGAEFTGLVSVLKSEMNGVQFSGFGHVVLGESRGAQFAGFFTIDIKKVHGWQFAGFMNLTGNEMKGLQCAGFTNIVTDSLLGVQISGFGNVTTKQAKGFQAAGFGNYTKGGKVSQASGFINISPGNIKGLQITGFSNITAGNMTGLQMSGAININANHLKGTQISGLFNFTKILHGVQIAPFNYTDSLEKGVPIGVLSFVRNGYMTAEFNATETLYGVFSFKTGVRQFYNILSTGIAYRHDMIIWGWGYGLGGMIPLTDAWNLSIEGLCYQMNEGEWFTNRLNLLNKLTITASWKIANHLNLFGGLSWNVTVSDITDEYGDPVESFFAPWSVFNETYTNHIQVKMYPGVTAGIRM